MAPSSKPDGDSPASEIVTPRAADIVQVLGGRKALGKISGLQQLNDRVRAGLPYAALEALMAAFALDRREVEAALELPSRTMIRRKKEARLRKDESDRLVRLANVAAKATDVLGEREKAARWLHRQNRALGSRTPLSLLDTELGARQVEAVLTRIEHGVFS